MNKEEAKDEVRRYAHAKDIPMCDHLDSFEKQYKATVLDIDGRNKIEKRQEEQVNYER